MSVNRPYSFNNVQGLETICKQQKGSPKNDNCDNVLNFI